MTRTERTRLALMRAAERLFLERGVGEVSLREIAMAAGQKNPSAALYHFGDKRGLIDAILERHSAPIQAGWLAILRHLDVRGDATVAELASLLVRPIVAKLDDPDGGLSYLALCAELTTSTTFPLVETAPARAEGANELSRRMMRAAGAIDPTLLALRMMRVAAVLYTSIHDYVALGRRGVVVEREAFTRDLVETITSVVTPASTTAAAPKKKSAAAKKKKAAAAAINRRGPRGRGTRR